MARLSIEVTDDEHKLIKMLATANDVSIKQLVMGSVVKLYPDISTAKNSNKKPANAAAAANQSASAAEKPTADQSQRTIYGKMEEMFKNLKFKAAS